MKHYFLTVTSKGQVTLPAEYRRAAGIETGSRLRLAVDDTGQGHLVRRRGLAELAGSMRDLAEGGPALDQSDIDGAVTEAMADQEARSRPPRRR